MINVNRDLGVNRSSDGQCYDKIQSLEKWPWLYFQMYPPKGSVTQCITIKWGYISLICALEPVNAYLYRFSAC